MTGAQRAQSVLIVDRHARIVKTFCVIGKIFAADLDEHLIRLDHVDRFDLVIIRKLTRDTAVAAADDQHMLDIRMHCHRDMHDHFIIDELVLLGEDHAAV